MRHRRYYDSIDYLLEKFCIISEKIIFGDSVIECVNQTIEEINNEDSENTTHSH